MNDHIHRNVPDLGMIGPALEPADIAEALQSTLRDAHLQALDQPIRFPSAEGAFPDAYFGPPGPVVPDANILRNDVLYACRHDRRTVLVNAANAGLLRLFCAQHVVDEVTEHIDDWTDRSDVPATVFRHRWMNEYLPLIRVVRSREISAALLSPEEAERIEELTSIDPDDVPSATLAVVLGALYLSKDRAPLRAVYGRDAESAWRAEWVETLKAGSDAGELGRMLSMLVSAGSVMGGGLTVGASRLFRAIGPLGLVGPPLLVLAMRYVSSDTRRRIGSAAMFTGSVIVNAFAAYHEMSVRFQQAAPAVATWGQLAKTSEGEAVLVRACAHTLARSAMSDRSARELAQELPFVGVPQGEAKVRSALRGHDLFFEVWRGRWQLGEVAALLSEELDRIPGAAGS